MTRSGMAPARRPIAATARVGLPPSAPGARAGREAAHLGSLCRGTTLRVAQEPRRPLVVPWPARRAWLYWRKPSAFSRLRSALVLATAAANVVFWTSPAARPDSRCPG